MPKEKETRQTAQRVGLLTGASLFLILLILPAPPALSPAGWKTTAVAVLMALWWMTEAIPIPVTALLPLVLFPIIGMLDMSVAAAPNAVLAAAAQELLGIQIGFVEWSRPHPTPVQSVSIVREQ